MSHEEAEKESMEHVHNGDTQRYERVWAPSRARPGISNMGTTFTKHPLTKRHIHKHYSCHVSVMQLGLSKKYYV